MAEPYIQIEENAFNVTYPMQLGMGQKKNLFGTTSGTDIAISLVVMAAWCSETEFRLRRHELHPTPVPLIKEVSNKARISYGMLNTVMSYRILRGFGEFASVHNTTGREGFASLKLTGDTNAIMWTDILESPLVDKVDIF